MREVKAAAKEQKPVLFVHCNNPKKGGASLDEMRQECGEERASSKLQKVFFDSGFDVRCHCGSNPTHLRARGSTCHCAL